MRRILPPSIGLFAAVIAVLAATAPAPAVEPPVMTGSAETIPAKLPRNHMSPVSLRLGFTSEGAESHTAPELSGIAFEISRAVSFDLAGLSSCSLATLLSSYENAEQACAGSLVGEGTVVSEIPQREGAAVKVSGRLLAFVDLSGAAPRILAQVTTGEPLPLVYVIPFDLGSGPGPLATTLRAHQMHNLKGKCRSGHPNCFADPYGVNGIYSSILSFDMDLHRVPTRAGAGHSFLSGRCPRRGTGSRFMLANVSLHYESGIERSGRVSGRCRALR